MFDLFHRTYGDKFVHLVCYAVCFISVMVLIWFESWFLGVADLCLIYVKKCSVYIQCKGDIVVVDIKQHKSQFKNSNLTITQSAKFF